MPGVIPVPPALTYGGPMKLPHLLLTLTLLTLGGSVVAQERTAAQPTASTADVSVLLRKLNQQNEQITTLQSQLNACRTDTDVASALSEETVTQPAAPEGEDEADAPDTYSHSRSTYHAVPNRRTSGVYQQSSEPRLTCDDYSMSYFGRHPAMAAVCGVVVRPAQPAEPVTETVSETRAVSLTIPQRTLPTTPR